MVKYLANLYAGAVLFLITGRIGISVLCNFSWDLKVDGKALFCVKSFISFLSIIRLLYCIVCISNCGIFRGQYVEIIGIKE